MTTDALDCMDFDVLMGKFSGFQSFSFKSVPMPESVINKFDRMVNDTSMSWPYVLF